MTFPKKAPDEIKLVTFDFTNEAAALSTLSNATVTATLLSGTGSAADLDINALSITVTGFRVSVLIGEGIEGAKYRVSCEVDASNGEHHRIDRDLPVAAKGALDTREPDTTA